MTEQSPVFTRQITLGSLVAIFLQCGGLGLLGAVASYIDTQHSDLQQIKANQAEAARQIAELVHWRDANESENLQWRRTVTESLDDDRHRLDRLDWVTNQRVLDGEQRSPNRRK